MARPREPEAVRECLLSEQARYLTKLQSAPWLLVPIARRTPQKPQRRS
jgi:hypothetical protein